MAIDQIKGESSMERVARAAAQAGLEIELAEMDASTRTAQEAADACGCQVAQIVKSLVFERKDTGNLVLVLVSGSNNADTAKLKSHFGTILNRADPRKVRDVTGFAIGGVAPIGDADLLQHAHVWAAAGKPNAVFQVSSRELAKVLGCPAIDLRTT